MLLLSHWHHQHQVAALPAEDPALISWNASASSHGAKSTDAMVMTTPTGVPSASLQTSPNASNALAELATLKASIQTLQTTVTAMNERLMVLTSQVNDEKTARLKKIGHRKPYRLLGVHLDQNTNAWVADIEYEDQVRSVLAGQALDGWQVRSVNAQCAVIE